jgi:hypothetical protein
MKICYVVEENRKANRIFEHRIGVAFENPDGSLDVTLQAFPVGGKMKIKEYVPRGAAPAASGGASGIGATPPAGYVSAGSPPDDDDIPF